LAQNPGGLPADHGRPSQLSADPRALDAPVGRDFAVRRFPLTASAANPVSGLGRTSPPELARPLMVRQAPLKVFSDSGPAGELDKPQGPLPNAIAAPPVWNTMTGTGYDLLRGSEY